MAIYSFICRVEIGRGGAFLPTLQGPKKSKLLQSPERLIRSRATADPSSPMSTDSDSPSPARQNNDSGKSNRFRLERFGKAMSGTDGWETPGAVLNGDFYFMKFCGIYALIAQNYRIRLALSGSRKHRRGRGWRNRIHHHASRHSVRIRGTGSQVHYSRPACGL